MKITKIAVSFFIIFSVHMFLCISGGLAEDNEMILTGEQNAEPALPGEQSAETAAVKEETVQIKTKVYETRTEDGWDIAINRYSVAGATQQECKAAVILCHGFNFNSKFWDIDKRVSLARFLAKNGYDVWAPSLRGSGMSSKPALSRIRSLVKFEVMDLPNMFMKAPLDMIKFGWTIDDHIYKDLPAIIDFVKKKSGFDKIYWIGHSMGGIVMFGYLETKGQNNVAGFIPIGSMAVIPEPLTPHLRTIANQKPLLTASLLINTTMASQLRNLTLGTIKNPIEDMLFESENMYDDVIYRLFRLGIDDTSTGVVTQFSDSIKAGSMLSSDARYSYTKNLNRVTVPILIMGGSADGFVTKKAMRDAYDLVSSEDKSILIFSKGQGYSTDYGHCDLLLGKNSEMEVYPVILKWLDERTK